jgi:hypothetical protein
MVLMYNNLPVYLISFSILTQFFVRIVKVLNKKMKISFMDVSVNQITNLLIFYKKISNKIVLHVQQ